MTGPSAPTVADVILALLLCGILGVLGQGVRAIVGLKNAGSLNSTTPGEQAVFSLAYLALSLMIGFIAGVLAGIALTRNDHHRRPQQLEAPRRHRRLRLRRRGLHRERDVGRYSGHEADAGESPAAVGRARDRRASAAAHLAQSCSTNSADRRR
jgi:hypothetical protein